MTARTTIDRLIINSPYQEPARHWRYERGTRTFDLAQGRRPAGYVVASGDSRAFDDPGIFVEIPLVNQIRPRVKDWREAWKAWSAAGLLTPPVMITVCNRTETAARVKHAFDSRRIHIDELCDNDHLGFEVLYVHRGVVRKYRPDFLVRLAGGDMLVLETKGQDTEQDRVKRRYLEEWTAAVTAHGGFGRWRAAMVSRPGEIRDLLV
jgi:hypothetical protein